MHRSTALRSSLLLTLALGTGGAALAQTATAKPAQVPASATRADAAQAPRGRPDQLIQRIHVEDSGARIDELRVGGQTQSITVKPKSGLPEYEILPTDGAGAPPQLSREGSPRNGGERVWKVFSF